MEEEKQKTTTGTARTDEVGATVTTSLVGGGSWTQTEVDQNNESGKENEKLSSAAKGKQDEPSSSFPLEPEGEKIAVDSKEEQDIIAAADDDVFVDDEDDIDQSKDDVEEGDDKNDTNKRRANDRTRSQRARHQPGWWAKWHATQCPVSISRNSGSSS